MQNPQDDYFFFICLTKTRLELNGLFVSQSAREFYESHFLGKILVCVHIICLNCQI